jgi:16S rRNA (cytosine1402-N4)-methyltransferase
LEEEALEALQVREDGRYLDATLGRAGHARRILSLLGPEGHLFALDRDESAIAAGSELFGGDSRVTLVHGCFADIDTHLQGQHLDGVLLDLGVSSPQLDEPERGFSFMRDGVLDMRMDPTTGPSAAEWLGGVEKKELAMIIRRLGEERFASRIAAAIIAERDEKPIETTLQLAAIIAEAVPVQDKFKHPATRTFQAIRMYINQELEQLTNVLPKTLRVMRSDARLVVISFHSLEDRIVKRFIRKQARGDDFPRNAPVTADMIRPRLVSIGKKIRAAADEVANNPRSRSAIMRVAERTEVPYV